MPTIDPQENEEQRRFEQHLRRFQPIAPPELKMPLHRRHWSGFAAAAAVLAIMTLFLMKQHSPRDSMHITDSEPRIAGQARLITSAQLRAALLASDEDFDRLLDDASPRILPHGQHGTVLYELGKE